MLKSYNLHGVKKIILPIFLISLIIFVSFPSYAIEKVHGHSIEANFKAIKGFIEEIYNSKIKIKDNYYDIEHAEIKDVSGNKISKNLLQKGANIEIHIKLGNNEVTEIIFYHSQIPQ